jgi:hypothetical protein
MGCVDFIDKMRNCYSISKRTKKRWMKNPSICYTSPFWIRTLCTRPVGEISIWNLWSSLFRTSLFCHKENTKVYSVPRAQPTSSETQRSQLEVKHSLDWTAKRKENNCCVCQMKRQTTKAMHNCKKCDCVACCDTPNPDCYCVEWKTWSAQTFFLHLSSVVGVMKLHLLWMKFWAYCPHSNTNHN